MAMKANELRVGNIIAASLKSGKGRTIEHTVTAYNIANIDAGTTGFIFSTIPLTEEWLLKFGFIKRDNYGNDEYRLDGYSYFRGSFYISDCDECGESVEINFVHELQNLYFALTKKELTIM